MGMTKRDNEFRVIGANIRRQRKRMGLTQAEMCKAAAMNGDSLNVSEISRIENGMPVSIGVINRIKRALGSSIHSLSDPSIAG